MNKIQRYDLDIDDRCAGGLIKSDEYGEWVKVADVEEYLSKIRAGVMALVNERNEALGIDWSSEKYHEPETVCDSIFNT